MKKLLTIIAVLFLSVLMAQQSGAQEVKMEPVNKDAKKKEVKENKPLNQFDEVTEIWTDVRPTIQLFYLRTTPSLYDEVHRDYQNPFLGEFSSKNTGEIRLGTVNQSFVYPSHNIAKYSFNGVFFKYMGPNNIIENKIEEDNYDLKIIQFGLSFDDGYGYQSRTNDLGFYLFTGSGIHWSDVNYSIEGEGDKSSDAALNTFDGAMRFGQTWESGIRVTLLGPLNIVAAYQQDIIFPRHMFWKWTISGLIEGVGIAALGAFSDWIMSAAPAAGPIINWALKTGGYFVLYKLRSKNMNWPYETAPPLVLDSWKVGMSFEF